MSAIRFRFWGARAIVDAKSIDAMSAIFKCLPLACRFYSQRKMTRSGAIILANAAAYVAISSRDGVSAPIGLFQARVAAAA